MAPSEHTLEHPQDTAGGGRRGSRRRRSCARVCRARSSRGGRDILGDDGGCRKLWLEIGDLMVLQELNFGHLLDHHHDLWGIPTAAKDIPGDADNLGQHEGEHVEGLLLDIELDEVPLILRTSCSISNPQSQCSTEEAVKSVKLWKEILDLGWMSLDTWSIYKLHLIQLEHFKSVNLSLWLYGQLVLKP
jgi:hypothetical protein